MTADEIRSLIYTMKNDEKDPVRFGAQMALVEYLALRELARMQRKK